MTRPSQIHDALDQIESAILPSLSAMLDGLIEAASLARPGRDAERYAAELRSLGLELAFITREVEGLSGAGEAGARYAA
jgi:hypothetical protein